MEEVRIRYKGEMKGTKEEIRCRNGGRKYDKGVDVIFLNIQFTFLFSTE